ncbi:MAG: hypothetical protein COY09_01700 [Candidatus Portnoybacteria bacterium CG_4_10_14_0_2_um_filter_39_11]|uniref:Uncharacterized protein n=1 Tax=Candidatus Portnoybacteria bacterium CG_4_10_14_0_2_um_filter_39_11 TaxID=1974797 RepID=A0A2M7UIF7_9BACT|nr:MAG: hypothetical protein AUJ33_02740 [Parcubacteria group bacterium CG1_02_40_25]PIZ70996.1 MAG: hypothetical protein COY09_01700 [Candidatus Portnoybacteria bacterium CG_4_10_14_0_2_um_filter_39_11]
MKRALTSIVIVYCLSIFVVGCGEETETPIQPAITETMPALAPSWWWNWTTQYQRSQAILAVAQNELNNKAVYPCDPKKVVGQCKWWVQQIVVKTASGGLIIPNTYEGGGDYNLACWQPGPFNPLACTKIIWQSCARQRGFCWAYYPTAILAPGHIVQYRWNNGGLHTAIIKSISSTNMIWIDCNWNMDCRVTEHSFSIKQWNNNIAAFTVYEIH